MSFFCLLLTATTSIQGTAKVARGGKSWMRLQLAISVTTRNANQRLMVMRPMAIVILLHSQEVQFQQVVAMYAFASTEQQPSNR